MVYHGNVANGVIRLDGADTLPEGAEVNRSFMGKRSCERS